MLPRLAAVALALLAAACASAGPPTRVAPNLLRAEATSTPAPRSWLTLTVDEAVYWTLQAKIGIPIAVTGSFGSETASDRPARARWSLDPGDEAIASLVADPDGASASLTFRAPGTVRVRATEGLVTGRAIFCAPLAAEAIQAAGAERLEIAGPAVAGPPTLVDSAEAWGRYWRQALAADVAAASAYPEQAESRARDRAPMPPAVDFETSSVVIVTAAVPPRARDPVLTQLDPAKGLIAFGRPMIEGGITVEGGGVALLVYRVPKLPPTARVRLDCRAGLDAPCARTTPFPATSAAPLAFLRSLPLAVGRPRELPDQQVGLPLMWRLDPRSAGLATLVGTTLTASAPGAVRLAVDGGTETMTLVCAATRDDVGAQVSRPLYGPFEAPATGARVFRTQAEWQAAWGAVWTQRLNEGATPATAPPPPPPPPPLPINRHVVLVRNPGPGQPVLVTADGPRFHLVTPGVTRGGVFTPAEPAQGAGLYLDVPAFDGDPVITFE